MLPIAAASISGVTPASSAAYVDCNWATICCAFCCDRTAATCRRNFPAARGAVAGGFGAGGGVALSAAVRVGRGGFVARGAVCGAGAGVAFQPKDGADAEGCCADWDVDGVVDDVVTCVVGCVGVAPANMFEKNEPTFDTP